MIWNDHLVARLVRGGTPLREGGGIASVLDLPVIPIMTATLARPITIALVEDNAGFLATLTGLLEQVEGFSVVGAHASGGEALAMLPGTRPDIVLMDLRLPDLPGATCIVRLRRQLPDTRILALTAHGNDEMIFDALRAGANGYLLKRAPLPELVEAIRAVRAGAAPMSAEIARRVVESFHCQPAPSGAVDKLTVREEEVLRCLVRGLTDKDISSELAISPETVRSHIKRIFEKFHARSRSEVIAKYLGTHAPR
jgi:DNA-binding NarL/FixJ family response regulator